MLDRRVSKTVEQETDFGLPAIAGDSEPYRKVKEPSAYAVWLVAGQIRYVSLVSPTLYVRSSWIAVAIPKWHRSGLVAVTLPCVLLPFYELSPREVLLFMSHRISKGQPENAHVGRPRWERNKHMSSE